MVKLQCLIVDPDTVINLKHANQGICVLRKGAYRFLTILSDYLVIVCPCDDPKVKRMLSEEVGINHFSLEEGDEIYGRVTRDESDGDTLTYQFTNWRLVGENIIKEMQCLYP